MGSQGRGSDLKRRRSKHLAGGALIAVAVVYLISTSMRAGAQYYLTIGEMLAQGEAARGRTLRISGAVVGDTIAYDPWTLTLRFTLAEVPAEMEAIERAGGLAAVLRQAVTDPEAASVTVVYAGPPPDLLRHEAQAIVSGRLGEDGVFYAEDLLLKCPTRYQEQVPAQSAGD